MTPILYIAYGFVVDIREIVLMDINPRPFLRLKTKKKRHRSQCNVYMCVRGSSCKDKYTWYIRSIN